MPPKKKVRVAVIGCGVISELHLRCYAHNPAAKVVAVCDLIPERAFRDEVAQHARQRFEAALEDAGRNEFRTRLRGGDLANAREEAAPDVDRRRPLEPVHDGEGAKPGRLLPIGLHVAGKTTTKPAGRKAERD